MASVCQKKKPCLESEFEQHSKILEQRGFKIGKLIGKGTYSKVCHTISFKAQCPENLACKIINKRTTGREYIENFLPRELKIIRHIDHPNIVTVYEIIEIDHVIYMFMDYCRNGDLLEYIRCKGALPEEKARHYFRQVVQAVQYLHNRNIAHRDLKCENVLLTANNNVKLCDFGFARLFRTNTGEEVMSTTFCGSSGYAAPEVLQGNPYNPQLYDIWALGCILYVMLTASMPYDDTNLKKMLKCQLDKSLSLSIKMPNRKSCYYVRNLLSLLLEPDPDFRCKIGEVVHHDWLAK